MCAVRMDADNLHGVHPSTQRCEHDSVLGLGSVVEGGMGGGSSTRGRKCLKNNESLVSWVFIGKLNTPSTRYSVLPIRPCLHRPVGNKL